MYKESSTLCRVELSSRNSLERAGGRTGDGALRRASTGRLTAPFSPHAEVQGESMEIFHLTLDIQVNLHFAFSFSVALFWLLFGRGRRGR